MDDPYQGFGRRKIIIIAPYLTKRREKGIIRQTNPLSKTEEKKNETVSGPIPEL